MRDKARGIDKAFKVLVIVLMVAMLLAPVPISILWLSQDYGIGHNSEIQSVLLAYIQEPAIVNGIVSNGGTDTPDKLANIDSAKYGAKQYQYYIVGMAIDYGECLTAVNSYEMSRNRQELDRAKEILSRFQNYQSKLKGAKAAIIVYPELLWLQQAYIDSIQSELEHVESGDKAQHNPGEQAARLLILSNRVEDSRNRWVSQLVVDITVCAVACVAYAIVGVVAFRSVLKSFRGKHSADEELTKAKEYESDSSTGGD